jgi:hypothetical protein
MFEGTVVPSYKWLNDRQFCMTGDARMKIRVIDISMIQDMELLSGNLVTVDTSLQVFEVDGSKGKKYIVTKDSKGWDCTCSGFQFRKSCKHVTATMTKNIHTVNYWYKEGTSGSWNQVNTIMYGRNVGKSTFQQEYINGILQESMRVLNKKYWPYQTKIDRTKHSTEMLERWCYDNLKSANWRNYSNMFAFKRQEDASYFLLMWS